MAVPEIILKVGERKIYAVVSYINLLCNHLTLLSILVDFILQSCSYIFQIDGLCSIDPTSVWVKFFKKTKYGHILEDNRLQVAQSQLVKVPAPSLTMMGASRFVYRF